MSETEYEKEYWRERNQIRKIEMVLYKWIKPVTLFGEMGITCQGLAEEIYARMRVKT